MSPMFRAEDYESDFSQCTEYTNDFLEEIDFNPDVDASIRSDIEFKFRRSTINPIYMFPRDELKLQRTQSTVPRDDSVRKSESVPRKRAPQKETTYQVPAKLPKLATQLINSSIDFFPDNLSPTGGRTSSLRGSPRLYAAYRHKQQSPRIGYGHLIPRSEVNYSPSAIINQTVTPHKMRWKSPMLRVSELDQKYKRKMRRLGGMTNSMLY